jgi:transcription elongation GreA/GreB family factor
MDGLIMHIFKKDKIEITEFDAKRLKTLIVTAGNSASDIGTRLYKLQLFLGKAKTVPSEYIKPDCVTMNSKIELQDSASLEKMIVTLVFPATALMEFGPGFEQFNVSILSPIGLSVLGRKVGDSICSRINITKILYQPEASGDYDL